MYKRQLHRYIQILPNRQNHAAPGGAVQLGEDDAGDAGGIFEFPGLIDGVLPGGGIQHQQNFFVRFGQLSVDDAVDLGELVHEILFIVHPAGSIADHHVRSPGLGGGYAVEHHGGGIRPLGVLDVYKRQMEVSSMAKGCAPHHQPGVLVGYRPWAVQQ